MKKKKNFAITSDNSNLTQSEKICQRDHEPIPTMPKNTVTKSLMEHRSINLQFWLFVVHRVLI